jgi:serine/threonine-protein kinase
MQPEPGAVIAGRYLLEAPLARGGMGSIWAARHLRLGSRVAVKFMDPACAADPSSRTRFAREAKAAATLKSPHIVQVHDYGIEAEIPYLVMELLEGEDLHARLGRRGRLSLPEAALLAAPIGKALRRAHEVGIIHRDLKPRNIFLARTDDEEIVKILDFGIAKQIGASVTGQTTRTGEILGTPHFMSPEQLRGERDVDGRSDLWSLGVILFRATTGQLPFAGEILSLVITKILVDPLPSALQIAPDLPPEIDAFFARALARDRDQRFASAHEMVEAFTRLAASASGESLRASVPALLEGGTPAPIPPGAGGAGVQGMLHESASIGGAVRSFRPRARLGAAIALAGGVLVVAALAVTLLRFVPEEVPVPPVEPAAPPGVAPADPPSADPALAVTPAGEAPPIPASASASAAGAAVAGAAAKPAERPPAAATVTPGSSTARASAPRGPEPAAAPSKSVKSAPSPADSVSPAWGF